MSYQPFPLADYRTGLFNAKEAWLAPPDAFGTLKNANIFRGRIRKRPGFKIYGYFPTRVNSGTNITNVQDVGNIQITSAGHGLSDNDVIIIQSVGGSTEINNLKFVVTNSAANTFELLNTSSLSITAYTSGGTIDQLKSLTYAASISATGISNEKGPRIDCSAAHGLSSTNKILISGQMQNPLSGMTSIEGTISTITVSDTTSFFLEDVDTSNYNAHTSGGDVFLVSESNSNGIVGIGELYRDESDNITIVANQRRLAKYDASLNNFVAISTSDIFTGSDTDLFQMTNFSGKIWLTNFKDRVYSYDGTTETQEIFDINGSGGASPAGGDNDLNRCKFIFPFDNRLMLLYTVEGGTSYPQRVRWSRVAFGAGTTSTWDDTANDTTAGSLDAATDEEIIAFSFLRDTVIVFFERSIWALRRTGDKTFPVRWEKLSEHPSVFASKLGAIGHNNFVWCFSAGGLIATDGLQIRQADELIPEFENEVDDGQYKRVFASKVIRDRETWIAYPTDSSNANDAVKVLDYENRTWAQFDIPYNIMSEFTTENEAARVWNQFTVIDQDEWENTQRTWASYYATSGLPQNLIGDNSGIINRINDGSSDQGRPIEIGIETTRMNPFRAQGVAVQLGYVDLLVTQNTGTSAKVKFYHDFKSKPYLTETLSFASETSSGIAEKVWKRVYVNSIGNSHRMLIEHKEAGQPVEIHAIVPYFRPSGRITWV